MENHFFRFEFKYPIPLYLMPRVENDLINLGFERDSSNANKRYYVSSIYFDTPVLSDYSDKSGGFLKRKKIRARIYENTLTMDAPNTPSVWLEIKEKYDMMIFKRRVLVTPNEWELLLKSPFYANKYISPRLSEAEEKILSEFIFWLAYERRKPYILIQYKRRAFQLKASKERIRVTLDYAIKAQKTHDFCPAPMNDVSQKQAVIEVKFGEKLPWQVKFILSKYALRRDSYSKYSKGIEAVRRYYPVHR